MIEDIWPLVQDQTGTVHAQTPLSSQVVSWILALKCNNVLWQHPNNYSGSNGNLSTLESEPFVPLVPRKSSNPLSASIILLVWFSSVVVWNGRIRRRTSGSLPILSASSWYFRIRSIWEDIMWDALGRSSTGSPFGITTCSTAILASCMMNKYFMELYCMQSYWTKLWLDSMSQRNPSTNYLYTKAHISAKLLSDFSFSF